MQVPRAHSIRAAARGPAGFTLIELTLVLIIIGLMASVAIVASHALLPNQRLNSAIRNLSERLHDTRSKAIAFSHEFEIHYDLDADSYYILTPYLLEGGFAIAEDDVRRIVHHTNLAPEGIDLVSVTVDDKEYREGKIFVRFDPLGASAYHTVEIMQVQYERFFLIEALPLTGEIRVFDEPYRKREPAEDNDFD